MQAEVHSDEDLLVTDLVGRVKNAADEPTAREAYRHAFRRLRSLFAMHPAPRPYPSAVFESVATTARALGASCLPLGIAVIMHLYPLCALQCVPLPLLSPARFRRAMLLRTIRNRSLILANAGSERTAGAHEPLVARRTSDGIRLDGTYEYMSLASVADVVLLQARLEESDCAALCAVDLRGGSVRVSAWKFSGRMQLSDTCSVRFDEHPVQRGRYVLVSNHTAVQCISDYQRSWFHLFLAETYLARLERLQREWALPHTAEHIVSLNEASRLRWSSLRLLDDFSSRADIESLMKTTGTLKLRVSSMAQSTATALRARSDVRVTETRDLAADIAELCYIRKQPTADEKLLRTLGSDAYALYSV